MNNRRTLLKFAGVLAVMPIIAINTASAAQNAAMRAALKYQDKPEDGKKCIDCMHFIPGADAGSLGGCRMFAGDTEISPNGYCSVWAKKS
jgi:hypothetical protein